MFWFLILLFTVIPVLELIVILKIGQTIGIFKTVVLVISIAILGAYLARLQGFLVLQKIQESLQRGIMPTTEILDGFLIFAAGVLLLAPGFITDIFGLILLFPITRLLVKKLLLWRLKSMVKNGQVVNVARIHRFNRMD